MKCQRIYSPTPLSTLNKLTIRLQQPNGSLVNSLPDTLDINGIFLSSYDSIRQYFNGNVDLSGTAYSDQVGEYIWIDCKKWFSRFQVAVGDRVQVRKLSCVAPTPAVTDLINFIQNSDGLLVAGTAFMRPITGTEMRRLDLSGAQIGNGMPGSQFNAVLSGPTYVNQVLVDGCNNAGYSRFIILRGKFYDPTLGNTSIQPYGNTADNSVLSLNIHGVSAYGGSKLVPSPAIVPGRLINFSKQTHLIFRVVTREYDSSSLVRPDNL
jgi:hypothetical protein